MKLPTIVAVASALFLTLPALADGVMDKIITSADRDRLTKFDATRADALAEAKKGGDAAELATLSATLAKPALSINDFDMVGDWQCRTTKIGGQPSLVVYGWFKCRVTDDGSGWMLEKLSGSQRTKGRFYTVSDTRLAYLGAGFYNNDPAPSYGKGPQSDQVGYATRTGPNEWRIEFPAPAYESKLDVLEFRR